jgi:iron(III) transport system permease protein
MSRLARLIGSLALLAAVSVVVGWPALATVLEATDAIARFQAVFLRLGWVDWASALQRWRGSAADAGSVTALDVSGSAGLLRETRGWSRPLRLGLETLTLVAMTESIALPLGVALAVCLFRTDAWGRKVLLALVTLAAFVPLPLHATAWLGALGNAGRAQVVGTRPILVGRFGAAVVHALSALPWVVLIAGVGLCAVEVELEEAARLEMAPLRVITRVMLRRAIGAIAASALAVAVLTAGDMTVTDLLQIRTYAEEAYVQYILGHGAARAAGVTLIPLVVLGGLILLAGRALARLDPARLISSLAQPHLWRLGRWRVPCGLILAALVGGGVGLPIYSLLWRAGRVGGRATLGRPPVWSLAGLMGTLRFAAGEISEPLAATLLWTALAATITTSLAFALAWSARGSRWWRMAALGILVLALATPGPVAGMAFVLAYRDLPDLGHPALLLALATPDPLVRQALVWIYRHPFSLYDSPMMIILAQTARALPYALLLLWPFLRAFPGEYLEAAALDGYGPLGRLWHVAVPLSRRALVAAWAISFALALGELPATNIVAPPGVPPMSVVLWGLLHTGVESHLAGVALIMLAVVATAGLTAALAVWSVRALNPT